MEIQIGKNACDNVGRHWNDAATSQPTAKDCQQPSEARRKEWNKTHPQSLPLEATKPC
jgi:hypothetical protein